MTQSTVHHSGDLLARNLFIDRVKTRLETYGWMQCFNGGCEGPNCLNGALVWTNIHPVDRRAAHSAIIAVREAIDGDPSNGDSIITWNDKPGRQLEDVLKLLDKAKAQPYRERYVNE